MTREELTLKAISTYNGNLHSGMTTALGAVVDMVLEEAAKVAEDCAPVSQDTFSTELAERCDMVAAVIRALKDKP